MDELEQIEPMVLESNNCYINMTPSALYDILIKETDDESAKALILKIIGVD